MRVSLHARVGPQLLYDPRSSDKECSNRDERIDSPLNGLDSILWPVPFLCRCISYLKRVKVLSARLVGTSTALSLVLAINPLVTTEAQVTTGTAAVRMGSDADSPEPAATSVDQTDLEVVARSEFETKYVDSAGAGVARLSVDPLNVRVDGDWVEVDPKLSKDGDGWDVERHPLAPEFAPSAGGNDTVTVSRDGHEVALSLVGADDGTADAPFWLWDDFTSLTYEDVLPDADLEYKITAGSVKEALVLHEAPAANRHSWTWRVDPGDLTPGLTDADVLQFVDATGSVVMSSPTPIAWDSSSDGSAAPREEIAMDASLVKGAGRTWYYRVSVDNDWLRDSARVYPVYIDPEVVGTIANQNSYKSDGAQYLGQQHVGNTNQLEGDRYWRAVVNFAGGAAVGKFIEASDLGITYAGVGSTGTHAGNVRVATKWQYDGYSSLLDSYSLGTGSTQTDGTTFPTYIATQFGKSSASNVAFMISGAEGSVYSHKRITTDLWVKYHPHVSPTIVTGAGVSPTNGATGAPLTPTFKSSASGVAGSSLRYSFRLFTDPSGAAIYTSPETTAGLHTVPDGVLKAGQKYYWRAYVRDAGWDKHLSQSTLRSTGAWSFTTASRPPIDAGKTFTASEGNLSAAVTTAVPAGESVSVPVSGMFGAPTFGDGLDSVVANFSIRSTTAQGSIRAWPTDLDEPDTTTLTTTTPQWASALRNVMVGSDGTIQVRNTGSAPLDVKVYMVGYVTVPPRTIPADGTDESENADFADDSQDQTLEVAPEDTDVSVPEALVVEHEGEEYVVAPEDLTPAEVIDVANGNGQMSTYVFPPNSPPPSNWRGCGYFDSKDKWVKEYVRLRVRSKFVGSVATLRCGDMSYGYTHIKARHMTDWANLGARVGVQWRDMADWSIAWMLQDPDRATASGSNYCFSRRVFVYERRTGQLKYQRDVRMFIGATGQRIQTAFPGSQCTGTNLVRW